jgi:hypothetical protein
VHESRKMSSLIILNVQDGRGGRTRRCMSPGRCPPSYIRNVQDGRDRRMRRCTVLPHYPQCSGRKGWEDAEVHESRKMSTLILRYTREHHMGKYSLRAVNQLGEAECSCDLIVRLALNLSNICEGLVTFH